MWPFNGMNVWSIIKENIKHEKFKKLATDRTLKIEDLFRKLGNLSARNNYEYTKADTKKIFDHIDASYEKCRSKFSEPKKDDTFHL